MTNANPATLENLQAALGSLSTRTLKQLEKQLLWYKELRPHDRAALGLMAQKGIASFVSWYQKPSRPTWVLPDIFGTAPTELARSISLQKALQLIRVVVGTVEDQVPELAAPGDEAELRVAVLRFSREVAFAAADVYARAAETRGSWDTRLEALVVDALLRAENSDSLRSRIAALGWKSKAPVTVIVGSTPPVANPTFVAELRRMSLRFAEDCIVGLQGERFVMFLGGFSANPNAFARIHSLLGDGPLVYSDPAPTLLDASDAAHAAFAALNASPALPDLPSPISANDLLPERALGGDELAKHTMVVSIYEPLSAAGNALIETLSTYVQMGHSLEATARELFVHANTVRYRLRRVAEITGWDPLIPREAFVLHIAMLIGRLSDKVVGTLQNGSGGLVNRQRGKFAKVWDA